MLYTEFNNRVEEKAQNNWGAVTDYTRHYLYEKYNDLYMSDEYETQEEAANAAAKELNQICKREKQSLLFSATTKKTRKKPRKKEANA
jgi:septin family protein